MATLDGVYVINTQFGARTINLVPGRELTFFVRVLGQEEDPNLGETKIGPSGVLLPLGRQVLASTRSYLSKGVNDFNLLAADTRLVVTPVQAPTQFSITPAGPNKWTAQLPGVNQVWTLDEPNAPVRLSPAVGALGQTWQFKKVDG